MAELFLLNGTVELLAERTQVVVGAGRMGLPCVIDAGLSVADVLLPHVYLAFLLFLPPFHLDLSQDL